MSLEEMRNDFEKVLASYMGLPPEQLKSYRSDDQHYENTPGNGYAHGGMDIGWWAWQASRAALVVELPAIDDPDCGQRVSFHLGAYKGQCRQAIKAAGLKVAP